MDQAWIEAFLVVVETGSFSQAAEKLYLSQSVVSKQIQKLEKHLGAVLVDRSHRQIALTAAGKRMYPEVQALSRQYRRMMEAACSGGKMHLVLLPVADQYGIPQFLSEFSATHPQIQLQLEEQTNTAAHEILQSGNCDGAFYRIAPDQAFPERYILLARDELVLLVPGNWKMPEKERMPLSYFRGERFLLLGSGTGLRGISLALCRQAGFDPQIGYSGSSGRNIAHLVRQGSGVALLAEQVARDLAGEELQLVHVMPTSESALIFAPSRLGMHNPTMAALMQALERAKEKSPL